MKSTQMLGVLLLVLSSPLVGAGLSAAEAASMNAPPDVLVVRVQQGADGSEQAPVVTPLHLGHRVDDRAQALAATAAATAANLEARRQCDGALAGALADYRGRYAGRGSVDEDIVTKETVRACALPCPLKADYARQLARRIVRATPTAFDVQAELAELCGDLQVDGDRWSYGQNYGPYAVTGSGPRGRYGATLRDYYPGLPDGQHPNDDIPWYTVTYNGYGNPFGPSGYTLFWGGYAYYYYFLASLVR